MNRNSWRYNRLPDSPLVPLWTSFPGLLQVWLLKIMNIYSLSSGGPKSEIKVLAGLHSRRDSRGGPVCCLFQLLPALMFLGLQLHHFSLYLCCHTAFSSFLWNLPLPLSCKGCLRDSFGSTQIIQDNLPFQDPYSQMNNLFPCKRMFIHPPHITNNKKLVIWGPLILYQGIVSSKLSCWPNSVVYWSSM